MPSFDELLAQYDYPHPDSAVALQPATPRDSARLLVLRPDGTEADDTFAHLAKHLPPQSLLVMNETKVIPARVEVTKPTGGKVRLLFVRAAGVRSCYALADRPIDEGMMLMVAGQALRVPGTPAAFTVVRREGSEWLLKAQGRLAPLDIFKTHGRTPIPPYLKHTPLKEKALREKYQTTFANARKEGSVAAPTASLHFTPRLFAALKKAGHSVVKVTLHVNLGTFAPLTPEHVAEGKLHQETFEVPEATAKAIAAAKKQGRPVIAVGTTACRALESAANAAGQLAKRKGVTRLFIQPGYRFRVIDGLITNFHVPKSSLLMLVAGLTGRERLLDAYRRAIGRGYRIFSFGDGMLILPKTLPQNLVRSRPVR